MQKKSAKKTRDEIARLNVGKLDAKVLIRKYVADFAVCHAALKDSTEWVVDQAEAYVEDAYISSCRANGGEAMFITLQQEKSDGEVETFDLKREFPTALKKLRSRWATLKYASRQFVSSEPIFANDTFLGSDVSLWVPK